MTDICVFRRVEKKYRITQAKKELLLEAIKQYLIPDSHGMSTVCSLYLDTPDFLLIRNSMEARTYKEKLRLRSYGTPESGTKVFFEIKKKFKGTVYKRRVSMTLSQAENYIENGIAPESSQIMNEIEYAMQLYRSPKPKALIAYEREAYFVKDIPTLRLTIDSNLRYRTGSLLLESGTEGKSILQSGEYILEVKTDGAMPIWLSRALSECGILPSRFSKYGAAYTDICSQNKEEQTKGTKEYVTV